MANFGGGEIISMICVAALLVGAFIIMGITLISLKNDKMLDCLWLCLDDKNKICMENRLNRYVIQIYVWGIVGITVLFTLSFFKNILFKFLGDSSDNSNYSKSSSSRPYRSNSDYSGSYSRPYRSNSDYSDSYSRSRDYSGSSYRSADYSKNSRYYD